MLKKIKLAGIPPGLQAVIAVFIAHGLFFVLPGILIVLEAGAPGINVSRSVGLALILFGAIEILAARELMQYQRWAYGFGIAISLANISFWIWGIWQVLLDRPTWSPEKMVELEGLQFIYAVFALIALSIFIYLLLPKTKQLFMSKTEKSAQTRSTDIAP